VPLHPAPGPPNRRECGSQDSVSAEAVYSLARDGFDSAQLQALPDAVYSAIKIAVPIHAMGWEPEFDVAGTAVASRPEPRAPTVAMTPATLTLRSVVARVA
jgi:hypothetical protein